VFFDLAVRVKELHGDCHARFSQGGPVASSIERDPRIGMWKKLGLDTR
jgi:hypothetical protein